MAKNNRLNKLKHGLVVLLAFLCALSASLFTLTACGKSDDATDTTKYSYTDKDDSEYIANSKFSYNLVSKLATDFPVSSPSGWTKSTENSTSSTVNSGVVDTTDAGWTELLNTLYNDSDFVNYVRNAYEGKIKTAMGKDDPTESEMNTFIKEHKGYDGENVFPANPARKDGDKYVYMLNNYAKNADYQIGTAQKVSSSSTVTVKAGETYKITFWINTLNVTSRDGDSPLANVRITSSVGGNSQSEYRIDKIDTNGEWRQYTVYVEGNENYDSTFGIALALGKGGKNSDDGKLFAEGTVYFDDVIVTKLGDNEQIPAGAVKSFVNYGSEDAIVGNTTVSSTREYAYSMKLENSIESSTLAVTDIDFPSSAEFTKSNVTDKNGEYITSKTIAAGSAITANASGDGDLTLTLKNASATVSVKDGFDDFTLNAKSYLYATFNLTNLLDKLGSTTVTVDVFEKLSSGEYKKTAAVTTYSAVGEDAVLCELLFKNNFESGTKEFYFDIVVGPTDVATANLSGLASGTITLSDLQYITGSTDEDRYTDGSDNPAYKLYSFFSSKADATVALYAGYGSDYSEDTDTASYNITVAPGNFGDIVSYPTAPKGYYGITANHIYVKEDDGSDTLDTVVNDRLGKAIEANKSYAGLINSKYLTAYGSADLTNALGLKESDDDIQPIVIYNATADRYGFIGTKNSVAASAYAKVSVKLRVVGDNAAAYVYLVNVAGTHKEVMELVDQNGTAHTLQRKITANMMEKGWLTVDFYVATGASTKDFRVEVWNGSRDAADTATSTGYVFVESINVTTSSAFTEPASKAAAFSGDSNPLGAAGRIAVENGKQVSYTRELTETETKFNKEYPDQKVEYKENYIWAETNSMVYAIYNTVDPVEKNPYDNITDDDDNGSGCNATTDSSTFWLSFSTILLAVVLVLAIIALIVKNVRAKRKANKSDAKSHYTVKSRIKTVDKKSAKAQKAKKEATEDVEENEIDEESEGPAETEATENADATDGEEAVEETENAEKSGAESKDLDDYVYGDVQDFGDAVTNEDKEDDSEEDK